MDADQAGSGFHDVSDAQSSGAFVQLTNVSRVYKTKSGSVSALNHVTFSIRKGERLALLGRSGSGKSTLLNLLAGLDRPTAGTITVDHQEIVGLSRDELAAYRLATVGIVFQSFNLMPTMTASQNVQLPYVFAGWSKKSRQPPAQAALAAVGLQDRTDHRPSQLSGGEQQRVAVARALVNNPSLILADEPTGNLDSKTAREVMDQMVQFSKEQQTAMVLVTHDEELASRVADRTLRLSDGRLIN
ncbi:MAG: ABC transporter ATP-binding protein [Pirellulaceae bacterium]|nr:ABC transporter ATP-binding protein [Pirellulaceae bacterium]